MDNVRIDKYLWAIRAFKTRTEASDACNGGKVKIGGVNAKASKTVKIGDIIDVRKGPVTYSYRVLACLGNRVGASSVEQFAENITPESELAKLHAPVETLVMRRDKGTGRPTKKERRQLEDMLDLLDRE